MRIAVVGRGFLGREFERQGFDVFGKEIAFEALLGQLEKYDVVVNCIAKSDTKWCEKKENFFAVWNSNVKIPSLLSMFCESKGKRFVHISTGCLYDSPGCDESSEIVAHCVYTMSKWAGEMSLGEKDLILRPRLFFSDVPDKNNLLCKLPKFTKYVDGVSDSFTYTGDIPPAVVALLEADQSGVFNIACEGIGSVFDVAMLLGLDPQWTNIETIRKQLDIHLVNCTMKTDKIKKYYEPSLLGPKLKECFKKLKGARG